MAKNKTIKIEDKDIVIYSQHNEDYISLTDMARFKNAETTGLVISHWISTRYTVEFMGLWEQINNPNFNVTEFRNIKIWIINSFPNTQKLNSIPSTQPMRNH